MLKKICVKNQKGQSIVETALIMPVIILILAGIIDFGLIFNNYLIITNASREGARIAAAGISDSDVTDTVASITQTLDHDQMTVSIVPDDLNRHKGEELSVTIGYNNKLLTPVINSFIADSLYIESKTVMRIE